MTTTMEQTLTSDRGELVQRICRALEAERESPWTLTSLGDAFGLSPHRLHRLFTRTLGVTPRQYADACRLRGLKQRLRDGENVTSALYAAGYGSSSRLYEQAPVQLGMTPATYRRGGRGLRIHYTTVASPLGRLLVGATQRGICAISLGDSDKRLETILRREYHQAEIQRDGHALRTWVRTLLAYLRGHEPRLNLPLDIQATAFERRVWEALRRIPYGETRSYSAIARAIGKPSAARAVARACAKNPVAIVIPCHRVVRADGESGGYRWGAARKRKLLARERRSRPGSNRRRLGRQRPRLRAA